MGKEEDVDVPENVKMPKQPPVLPTISATQSVPLSEMIHQMRDTSDNFNVNGNANSMGSQDKQNSVSSDLSSLKTSYGNYHSGSNILGMRTHWRTRKNVGNEEKKQLERENSQHKPQHGWTPDRGLGYYSGERERQKRPSLVETGRNAGRSRVMYTNRELMFVHSWMKDSFISALNTPLKWLALAISLTYLLTFFFFAAIWWGLTRAIPDCITSVNGFANAYIFSMVTQQTIGYGNNAPNDCYYGALVITVQTLVGLFLDAITLGVIFARISHPKNRGRTIGISDSSVISRRDGILKFMFRIADFRDTQVVEPNVKAYLYTWGRGRTTAEGEHIPCRIEQMEIHHIDGMLLLPIIIEHTIDERSPLCGHTYDTLTAVNAELVVTFEGTTEMGNPFMARQSYLPSEIQWGHQFVPIIRKPKLPSTRYLIEIEKFHDVEPQVGLELMPPGPLSRLVVSAAARTVPYPLLGENTLVLSDSMVLSKDENGELALMFRIGDTYPTQHLDVQIRAYLYRWRPSRNPDCGKPDDVEIKMLEVGYEYGDDRILLWLPWIAKHVIREGSPLENWLTPNGFMGDANSTIAVQVEGYMYCNSQNRMRMRIYNVLEDVKRNYAFKPIVTAPSDSPDYKPRVDWMEFHSTRPLEGARPTALRPTYSKTFTSSDPTVGITNRTTKRESIALSKISFDIPDDDEVPGPSVSGRIERRQPASPFSTIAESPQAENLDDPIQNSHTQDTHVSATSGSGDERQFQYLRSRPPESMFMLTPQNDPENAFALRHKPPSLPEHTFMNEDEAEQSLGKRASISGFAKSSLQRAFSNTPVERKSKHGPENV